MSEAKIYAYVLAIALVGSYANRHLLPQPSLSSLRDKVLETCEAAGFAPSCYDEEVPKLMDRISMEEAFRVVQLIQEKDPRYLYCHVVGHKITYRESQKDPAKWRDIITRCPSNICNNGCLHGAVIERFTNEFLTDEEIEKLLPDVIDVCEPRGEWHPTELERSMCYHGLGHLFMYVSRADARKSSELCKTVGVKSDGRNYVQTCTEGAFMQIYQPLEPEDFALVKDITPKKEDVPKFCEPYKSVSDMAWQACRREAWAIFRNELKEPQGLVNFCSYAKDGLGQRICYGALMNDIAVRLLINDEDGSLDKLAHYCDALPESPKGLCYGNAARRLVQIDAFAYQDMAQDVCRRAEVSGAGKSCYQELANYGLTLFHEGSKELGAYCSKFPTEWRTGCENQ